MNPTYIRNVSLLGINYGLITLQVLFNLCMQKMQNGEERQNVSEGNENAFPLRNEHSAYQVYILINTGIVVVQSVLLFFLVETQINIICQ